MNVGRFKLMRRRGPPVPTDPAVRAFRAERRRARLKVIPSLFTLGNAACGFAAIVQVASLRFDPVARAIENPENLIHAAWLVLLAMLFDVLDGRIARLTATTGDFGGELDSLCDAVSFGVAPALMVAMANSKMIASPLFSKLAWIFGLALACGAILRLARFNVENTHEDEAHLSFKGLPSPAAAGTIVSLLLAQGFLRENGWTAAAAAITTALPFVALAVGWLMVSTIRYVHLPNRYLRGRKSVRKIAQIFFAGAIALAVAPELAIALGFVGFAFSGPIAALRARILGLPEPVPAPPPAPAPAPVPVPDPAPAPAPADPAPPGFPDPWRPSTSGSARI